MGRTTFSSGLAARIGVLALLALSTTAVAQSATGYRALIDQYCVGCHNQQVVDSSPDQLTDPLASQLRVLGLALDSLDLSEVARDAAHWEKVVRKLRAGLMPPAGMPRPDASVMNGFRNWLETELDTAAQNNPDPGRTASLHRLNRAEYSNAIRDLLALEIDIESYLPADDASYGFDNIGGVLRMSQSLLERYLEASRQISRLAIGRAPAVPISETFRAQQDEQQHARITGLPFGTRGGILAEFLFSQDADYELRIQLTGLRDAEQQHTLVVTVDGAPVETIAPGNESTLALRLPVSAGPHQIGVTFNRLPLVLVEQARERFQNPRSAGNRGGPYGAMPFVSSLTITGPFSSRGPGRTPSRDRIFTCSPADASEEAECATAILSNLARKAYRRPVSTTDLDVLLEFYRQGRAAGSFEDGIELALRRLLVSPDFLVRIESAPNDVARNTPYRISDLELASRLSFFLWSSIPDEELLTLAVNGELGETGVLRNQIARMLADPRSSALTSNFAGQWLQLRNLATLVRPGEPYAVEFDETLRRAMIIETELFFSSVVNENRSVLELLTADYTFVNARLADHYGLPGIQGSHFRKVILPEDSPRRGLLGHGSILTLTSHAIRTSPVLRGKWILNNILGTPPPDPPPNVPALDDRKTSARVETMRERMAAHRNNPVCAACHTMIDPAGFALESFDAIGRFREVDQWFNKIDTSGMLPDGTSFDGAAELRLALVEQPERFVGTFTEKLLTYALGRGLEYYDMPAVRRIVRESAVTGYSMQAIIAGIVTSYPFLYRRSES